MRRPVVWWFGIGSTRVSAGHLLAWLEVDAADAVARGYEPIWHNGWLVGFATSGGYGRTVGRSLAALIDSEAAASVHDPKGGKMRA